MDTENLDQQTILIADDSPTILDMLQFMLNEMGYNTVPAVDGLDAIQKTYDNYPDLIILDILMPKMNGYQVCRLLKEDQSTKHIPIIILTSKIEKSHRFWGIETGADSYLTKDFEPDQLFDEIEKLLAEKPSAEIPVQKESMTNITLSNVLEHVNLLLDRKLFHSTIVNEIRKISQSRIELEDTIRLLLHMLDSICDFSAGAILLQDEPVIMIFYVPDVVETEFIEEMKIRTFEQLPSQEVLAMDPLITILQRTEDDEATKTKDPEQDTSTIASFLFLPLIMRGEFVGGISLASIFDNPWQEETLETLQMFAKEAVLVMNQALLRKNLEKSNIAIQKSNEHLKEVNEKLSSTIQELKETQTQLIQSEKMASLGQLIAGVAHEINTPAGAINAAIHNITNYVKEISNLQKVLMNTNFINEDQNIYFQSLEKTINTQLEGLRMSTVERRKKMKEIEKPLKEIGIAESRSIARTYASMNIDDYIPKLLEIAERLKSMDFMKPMINFSNMAQSVRDIKISIDAITRLVKALKTYSHLDQSQISRVDIHEGLETTLTIMHNQLKYGIEVFKDFSDLPQINCYVNELNQVWTNIIHNAIQAMGGRGILKIRTFLRDNALIVKITDNGPGIPPEFKDKIFEPFFTTKKAGEGTGMGLDLVLQIVEKHHGTINVESVPGETSFEVVLPIDKVELEE